MKTLFLACSLLFASSANAEGTVEIVPPAEGSVSTQEGLAAWDRVYEVASHPRCSNCHVGADNRPMWSGPSDGKPRPHGMNVNGGESRIGVETLMCSTCHSLSEQENTRPHEAPRVGMSWQLAPVEAEWFGKTSEEVGAQLRNPDLNGDRTYLDIAQHLDHDLILHWAWAPGPGRTPTPHDLHPMSTMSSSGALSACPALRIKDV